MKGKQIIAVLSFMFVGQIPDVPFSTPINTGRDSLIELKGVYLWIEGINRDTKDFGVDREKLRDYLRARLDEAGVSVLPMDEAVAAPGKPILTLHLRALEQRKERYAFTVELDLAEEVFLVRRPELPIPIYATTWQSRVVRLAGLYTLDEVRESVDDCVDAFVADYQAAKRSHMGDQRKARLRFNPWDLMIGQKKTMATGHSAQSKPHGSSGPSGSEVPEGGEEKKTLTLDLPAGLVNRLMKAVAWAPGVNVHDLAEKALQQAVHEVEKRRTATSGRNREPVSSHLQYAGK